MPTGTNANMALQGAPRTRAFVNMHAQLENAGDALVLRELVKLISSRIPTDLYLKDAPDSFIRELHLDGNRSVTAHRGDATVTLIRHVVRARLEGWRCYYFLTAGAPHGERTWKQFASDILRICWLALLTIGGVRVCQVGVSFENIGPRHARVLRLRSRVLFASVPRDQLTLDYMQSLGIRATGMMPDVTINMFSTPPAIDSESRNGIGFSFRVDKDATTRDPITRLIKQVCERTSPDDELVFVGQVGRDVTFMRELAAVAEQIRPGQVHFLDCHTDIDSAFSAYRGCRAVLSNRLHALLPALKEGASPIALTVPELDPKITGVFESIGLSERVLDIRSAEMDEVVRFMAPMTFDGSAAAKDLNYFFDELLETTVNGVRPQRAAKN